MRAPVCLETAKKRRWLRADGIGTETIEMTAMRVEVAVDADAVLRGLAHRNEVALAVTVLVDVAIVIDPTVPHRRGDAIAMIGKRPTT